MQTVQYVERAPVYSNKGDVVTSSVVQHSALPASHPPVKQVLLDTRDDKLRIAYSDQQRQSVDKESLSMQNVRVYETKGDERLERVGSLKQQPQQPQQPQPAIVQQMQKPLPSIPTVVQSSELAGRTTSEPQYVTVYEDGATLFSPRTINLLGTAARLPPPPPPAEPTTPTSTIQFPATATSARSPAPVFVVTEQSTSAITAQPAQQAAVSQTRQPVGGAVAVPSWPPAESEHDLAVAKRVVEASTVREESPLMVGVEKAQPSPLLVSAGPQPYELAHPKNAIDVVQLPPPQPSVPVATVETVASNTAPLALLPPKQAAPGPKPAPAPPALPAPTAAVPAPRPPMAAPAKSRPAVVPAPAAPRRQWKMPRLFDVVLSPWAMALYVLAGLLLLTQLPFWLIVTLAVALDAAVIYFRRPVKQIAVVPSAPRPLALPAPIVSSAAPALALPAPRAQTAPAPAPSAAPAVPAGRPHHVRSSSREFGTQTELPAEEEHEQHEEAAAPPRSPADFFKTLRQQHGGSPPASDRQAAVRAAARDSVPMMRKLAPSARQQATVPLLADAQAIAPEGVILSDSHQSAPATTSGHHHSGRHINTPERYVHPVPHEQSNALPSPSKLPNPMLDALNSASPRRELNDLTHAVDEYNDMQPETALAPQVHVAARRAVVAIPSSDAAAAVQGAANPVVMVPTWPSTEQQHAVAQARHVVEASTVRDHSVLLDGEDDSTHALPNSQPYEMTAVPHSTTLVNQTDDMMALPAPKGPVATTAPLALPFPAAPSFRVPAAAAQPAPAAGDEALSRPGVKRLAGEEKEEAAVVADVGGVVSVRDVGAGITGEDSAVRLRNIASHVHSQ